jgi:hypothetical protein
VSGDRTRPQPTAGPRNAGAPRRSHEPLELGLEPRVAHLKRQPDARGGPLGAAFGRWRAALGQPHDAAVGAEVVVARLGRAALG